MIVYHLVSSLCTMGSVEYFTRAHTNTTDHGSIRPEPARTPQISAPGRQTPDNIMEPQVLGFTVSVFLGNLYYRPDLKFLDDQEKEHQLELQVSQPSIQTRAPLSIGNWYLGPSERIGPYWRSGDLPLRGSIKESWHYIEAFCGCCWVVAGFNRLVWDVYNVRSYEFTCAGMCRSLGCTPCMTGCIS